MVKILIILYLTISATFNKILLGYCEFSTTINAVCCSQLFYLTLNALCITFSPKVYFCYCCCCCRISKFTIQNVLIRHRMWAWLLYNIYMYVFIHLLGLKCVNDLPASYRNLKPPSNAPPPHTTHNPHPSPTPYTGANRLPFFNFRVVLLQNFRRGVSIKLAFSFLLLVFCFVWLVWHKLKMKRLWGRAWLIKRNATVA